MTERRTDNGGHKARVTVPGVLGRANKVLMGDSVFRVDSCALMVGRYDSGSLMARAGLRMALDGPARCLPYLYPTPSPARPLWAAW